VACQACSKSNIGRDGLLDGEDVGVDMGWFSTGAPRDEDRCDGFRFMDYSQPDTIRALENGAVPGAFRHRPGLNERIPSAVSKTPFRFHQYLPTPAAALLIDRSDLIQHAVCTNRPSRRWPGSPTRRPDVEQAGARTGPPVDRQVSIISIAVDEYFQ
jgi:hypothetical protein